ncbi:MAG: glycosyltransferase family 2 protein [Rikenellaceae bacterium]
MRVSIITTCYNREQTIRETIESILAQEYHEIEYIVVDGASTDGSLQIIEEYRDHISTIISERDSGMYEAINKGIRASTGDIVGLLHSDDTLYDTTTIGEIVAHLHASNADILYGDGIFVDEHNPTKIIRNWISGIYTRRKVRSGWLPLHPTLYIRRSCLQRWGLYDESYTIAADSDLLVRYLHDRDLRVVYLERYIVRMRMGGVSTTPSKMVAKWREDLRLYSSHGINPYWALWCKVISKIPQYISAKFINLN